MNEFQIKHWKWISTYYMCTIGDIFRCAMPSAFILESETIISQKKETELVEAELSDDEFLIYEALQHQSSLKVQDVMAILNKKNIFPIIQKLLNKNVLSLQEEMIEEYKPKLIRYIRIHNDYSSAENLKSLVDSLKGSKQKEVVMHYFHLNATQKKPISVKQLSEVSQVSTTIIKTLVDKTIFEEFYIQEDRVNFENNKKENNLILSEAQQKAYKEIK